MGMVWTSLIFKFSVLFLTAVVFEGCSQSSVTPNTSNGRSQTANQAKWTPGPTQVSTQFMDQTEVYGLGQVEAEQIHVVDWSGDGHDDLVILPEIYQVPEFYRFIPKKKRFERVDEAFFETEVRASSLVFADLDKDDVLDL